MQTLRDKILEIQEKKAQAEAQAEVNAKLIAQADDQKCLDAAVVISENLGLLIDPSRLVVELVKSGVNPKSTFHWTYYLSHTAREAKEFFDRHETQIPGLRYVYGWYHYNGLEISEPIKARLGDRYYGPFGGHNQDGQHCSDFDTLEAALEYVTRDGWVPPDPEEVKRQAFTDTLDAAKKKIDEIGSSLFIHERGASVRIEFMTYSRKEFMWFREWCGYSYRPDPAHRYMSLYLDNDSRVTMELCNPVMEDVQAEEAENAEVSDQAD